MSFMFTLFAAKGRRRTAGFTLVEVMVAAFLGALVLYVLITTLIPALKLSALGTTKVDLDGRAAAAEQRLIGALRATARAGVMTIVTPQVTLLSTHPVEGTLADSKQKWAQYLDVFSWQDQALIEWHVGLPDPAKKPTVMPLEELTAALPDSERQFIIQEVVSFTVTVGEGPRVDFGFTLQKDKDKLEVQRTVFVVNSSQ